MKSDLDAKRASGIIHAPNSDQAKMINALINGLAGFSDPELQSVARMLARRTILVDESMRTPPGSDQFLMGETTPTIPGYENIIRLNPERIADPGFYYADASGQMTIPYSLLNTLPHENLHLVFQEMGYDDPSGDYAHSIMKNYIHSLIDKVLNGRNGSQ
jgi:hypothetical protein